MDIKAGKRQLLDIVNQAIERDYVKSRPQVLHELNSLMSDIHRDFYTVVVLGEFKRGKSTFVNAILGEPLLPMDVLPETAVISAIMYDDKPCLSVVHSDGTETEGKVSLEYLQRFSAQSAAQDDLADIRYIKIGYPIEMLKNRVVLVDTPGVSDMNQQRSDVTYQFLPCANTVLFLLDANSPLKKTEKDFIEQQLVPLGITDIMFLVNKYDCVDEEEDEDLLDELQERLSNAFGIGKPDALLNQIELFPISAKQALDASQNDDAELMAISGMPTVKERLQELLTEGHMEQTKVTAHRKRLYFLIDKLGRDLNSSKMMKQADADTLQQYCDKLDSMLAERGQKKDNIRSYAEHGKESIFEMADKSLAFFQNKLSEEVCDNIEAFRGTDFKEYVEQSIPRMVKKNIESWSGLYGPHLDEALSALENELARGLSYYFNQQVRLVAEGIGGLKSSKAMFSLEATDISNVNLQAGAIAAVGSLGLLALVGGVAMPLVSLAALPFLREKMLKEKLAAAKEEVIPAAKAQIVKAVALLRQEVHKYIDQRTDIIISNTEYAYEHILLKMRQDAEKEIISKQEAKSETQQEISLLLQGMEEINRWKGHMSKID